MAKSKQVSDIELIQEISDILDQKGLAEIEVARNYGEHDTITVRVSRHSAAPAAPPAPAPVQPPPAPAAGATSPPSAEAPPGGGSSEDISSHPGLVSSPMVGTAYLQPEEGAPPFVKAGDSVSKGETLLIVEAMKTMNHIPAPHSGTVRRVLVENASPVEYGAPLMIIE